MKKLFTLLLVLFLINNTQAQQATQTIRGTVVDDVTRIPLIGANVIVVGSKPILGASTDVNGAFKITGVPVGRQALTITYLGYEEQFVDQIIVTAGKEIVLNITLTERVNQINEAVVTYDRTEDKTVTNNDMVYVSGRSFNIDDTKKFAGSFGDPSRMVANYAGVTGSNDSRNDIVVRGNSPGGLLWQMGGLNIPNPNHFGSLSSTGGPVSILNNNVLDKSDFLTGAFPAQYGNALSSVFDLRMRNGNTEKSEFLAQVGFNGFEANAEGPLSKKHNSSYLISYRYSTLALFNAIGINFGTGTTTPVYQDASVKLFFPVGIKSKLSLWAIGGNSKANFLGNDVDTTIADFYGDENSNTKVKYGTLISGASLETNISDQTFSKLTIGFSSTYEKFVGDSISAITREEFNNGNANFTTDKYTISYQVTHKFNAKNSLIAGANTDLLHYKLFNEEIGYEEYPDATKNTLVDATEQTFLTQAFAQLKHRFTEKFSATAGLHAQQLSYNNSFALEARAGLRYLINTRQAINFGYGMHSQMQNIYLYSVQTPTANGVTYTNKDLDFTKAHHFVLSYDYNINDNWRLKAEAYYQHIYNAPVTIAPSSFSSLNTGNDFAPTSEDSLVNNGTGNNYGAEITLEKFYSKGYYILLTTSLFQSKYKGSDEIERNTAFNTQYAFNVLAGKEFKLKSKGNSLAFDIKVSTSGGKYYTPINFDASAAAGQAVYYEDQAYSLQQDPYFRIDFKVTYKKNYSKSTLEIVLDLQNVTNNQNLLSQNYNPRTNTIVNQYQQSFFPVPMVRYTF